MAFRVFTPAGASPANYDHELESLRPLGLTIEEAPAADDAFIAAAQEADVVYNRGTKMDRRLIEALPKLKLIALGSVGFDQIDVVAATERGVAVTNCPDTFIEEVAEHTMALMLAAHRRVVEQDRMVREGRWKEGRPALYEFPRLMGQTLGFISFGRIPRAVAQRARAFHLHMLAFDPFVEEVHMPQHGVHPATLDEVLERSDIVSMHAPGSADTHKLMGAAQFAKMKRGAIFINTGRGATVDEAAMIDALRSGQLGHAGLDVLEQEPPAPDNPLLGMSNVTLSAHVASASSRFDPARKRRVGQQIALVASGKQPTACVNPAVLHRRR